MAQLQLDDDLTEMVYPPNGMLFKEEVIGPVFCKPKLIPLKSVTLERLEKMQQEGLEKMRQIEAQKAIESKIEEEAAAETVDGKVDKRTDIWQAE
uniref:BBSome-interacting protein 1 n=1 Tax=Panagrolaimus sp. JU765 TaxID=591449 RepID=A0AC34QWH6_9BILA